MMTPEQGESYERRLLRERPKFIPMEPEELAKLSPVSEVDDINFVFLGRNIFVFKNYILCVSIDSLRYLVVF